MPKLEEMTLEEKVDELLKYQRKLHYMAILKTVFSFLTFLILVVLPIAGAFYLADYVRDALGLSLTEIGETLRKIKGVTDINGVDSIKNFLK
ncbi:hypothetical protein JXD20_01640 [Candidatus Peregrinibacteria bacterium]|nr:hypothetical protein [Candidatus Peregrinibacteria bacterium]